MIISTTLHYLLLVSHLPLFRHGLIPFLITVVIFIFMFSAQIHCYLYSCPHPQHVLLPERLAGVTDNFGASVEARFGLATCFHLFFCFIKIPRKHLTLTQENVISSSVRKARGISWTLLPEQKKILSLSAKKIYFVVVNVLCHCRLMGKDP